MRILMVNNLYPPVVFGGYEILCQQVTERLRSLGHAVEVLTSDFMAQEVEAQSDVFRKLALTTNFPLPGQNVGQVDFSLRSLHRVARLNEPAVEWRLRDFQPDVVFCWCLSRLSLAAVWVAQKKGIPLCYTINDEHSRQYRYSQPKSWKESVKWFRERWIYPKATLSRAQPFPITCISQALKSKLLEQNLQIDHAEVIYQGIPLEAFPYQPTPRSDEAFQLLYVGQISKAKGVHTLIEALGKLIVDGKARINLSVLGSGVPEYQDALGKLTSQLRIEEQVKFLGRVSHSQVSEFYRASHAFVFPSEWDEPFGLTHLEAMASGAAVISTTTGGSAELIRHEENALAFQAGDSGELACQILRLAGDEDFRLALIKRARKYVEEKHSLDIYTNHLEDFLKRTCLK